MSWYEVVSRRLYHNEGYLKGVDLQPEPVSGPEIARTTRSAIWALNRQDGAQVQKITNGGIVYSLFWVLKSHERQRVRFGPKTGESCSLIPFKYPSLWIQPP